MTTADYIRHDLETVHGYPMIYAFAKNWERIGQFQCKPEDVWIITYPKSGTTWVSEIMDLIKNDGCVEKQENIPVADRIPMMESAVPGIIPAGTERLEKMPSPRFVKSHLPISLLPTSLWESNCTIIYLARNAKDVAVSYYNFDRMNKFQPEPGTFAEYLEKFMSGNDPKREIRKVMQFLGKKLDEETLDRIVQRTSFETMKDNLMVNYKSFPTTFMDHNISPFMRKGIVGDWKNYFTVAQNEIFDADYEKKMSDSGTTLKFRTEI